MKVKKGDNVKIISGKDRGMVSEIVAVFPRTRKVVVKGANIATKHQKSRGESKPGGRIKFELPIDASNVQIIDDTTGKPSRVSYKNIDGKKTRVFKAGKLASNKGGKKVEDKKESVSNVKKTKINKSSKNN